MGLIRRYLTGFRGVDTDAPGLFEKDDGTSWYRKPDGSEAEIGTSGALPVNWAKITLADPGTPLTVAADTHNFLATEVSIDAQSGTDFSVVDGGGGLAAVVSASGGRFQVGCYLANPDNATLDAGSTLERYLEFAATIGGADDPLTTFGLDTFVPIVPSPRNNPFVMASCCASTIGYAAPGGQVAANLKVFLVGGIGTDSVPLSSGFGFTNFTVYQV